jgi:hypothetical protein
LLLWRWALDKREQPSPPNRLVVYIARCRAFAPTRRRPSPCHPSDGSAASIRAVPSCSPSSTTLTPPRSLPRPPPRTKPAAPEPSVATPPSCSRPPCLPRPSELSISAAVDLAFSSDQPLEAEASALPRSSRSPIRDHRRPPSIPAPTGFTEPAATALRSHGEPPRRLRPSLPPLAARSCLPAVAEIHRRRSRSTAQLRPPPALTCA